MASLSDISVQLTLDTKGFQSALDKATSSIKDMAQDTSSASKSLANLENMGKGMQSTFMKLGGVLAGAFAVDKIVDFGKKAVGISADVQEMENKFNVVFRGMTKEVDKYADNFGDSIGRTREEVKEFLANNADLFSGFGMTTQAAFDLSKNVVKLGYDLASFNNLADDDAINKIKSGLVGEHDAVKALGIALNETTLAETMHQMGLKGKFQDLSETQKMTARYNTMLKQSKNALDDAKNSSSSYTNQLKEFKGKMETIQAVAGGFIRDSLTPLYSYFNDMLPNSMEETKAMFDNLFKTIQENQAFKDLSKSIQDAHSFIILIKDAAANGNWAYAGQLIGDALKAGFDTLASMGSYMGDKLGQMLGSIDWAALGKGAVVNVVGFILGFVNALFDLGTWIEIVQKYWKEILSVIVTIMLSPGAWAGRFAALLSKIPFVGKFAAQLVTWINDLGGPIRQWIDDIVGFFGKGFTNGFGGVFKGLPIGQWFSGLKAAMKGKWDDLTMKLWGLADDLGLKMGKWFGGVFQKPLDAISDMIKGVAGMASKVKDAFLGLFRFKLPKMSISWGSVEKAGMQIPWPKIDWFATGGIFTSASVIGVGEAGDEAVVPLSNKSRMKPFASAVASMINGSSKPSSTVNSTSGDLIVKVEQLAVREEADVQKVARELYKIQERNRRAKGEFANATA